MFCDVSGQTEHRPAGEIYLDPEINIAFPASISRFRKKEVIRSFNPMIGTTVRYTDPDGNCADVYIYLHPESEKKITEESLKSHFAVVKQTILYLPSKGASVKKSELLRESGIKIFPDQKTTESISGYQAAFWISTGENVAYISHLMIFPFKEKIIKLRMSCDENTAAGFSMEIFKLFFPE
jgi:hypothetical protein